MIKSIYTVLGLLFLVIAWIGVFLPGIPTTFPAIVAAFFFKKSSPELNYWIHNNKFFGHLVKQWEEKRIYPLWGKFSMFGVLFLSNLYFYFNFLPTFSIMFTLFSISLIIWSLPYPTSEEDYQKRIKNGEKLGWIS